MLVREGGKEPFLCVCSWGGVARSIRRGRGVRSVGNTILVHSHCLHVVSLNISVVLSLKGERHDTLLAIRKGVMRA